MAQNPTDEAVARLEAQHPAWQIWVVHPVYGGPVWCGRRWDGTGRTLNAANADELAGYIAGQAGSQPGQ